MQRFFAGLGGAMSWRMEVVAICDHLVAFGAAELEDKIGGKKCPALRLTCSFSRLVGTP